MKGAHAYVCRLVRVNMIPTAVTAVNVLPGLISDAAKFSRQYCTIVCAQGNVSQRTLKLEQTVGMPSSHEVGWCIQY